MAKLKLKNKKKNLPKFTVGGYNSNNSIYATQVGDDKPFISSVSSSDPFGVQKDLNNSSLTKSSQPLMFAGQAPQSSGLNIDAGRFVEGADKAAETPAPSEKSGPNWGMIGQGVQVGAKAIQGNRKPASLYSEKTDNLNTSVESAASSIPVVGQWLGAATSLRDMGMSGLPKDEAGNITGSGNKIAADWMTADHTHILNAAQEGDAAGAIREASGFGKVGRTISNIAGKGDATSGGWGEFNRLVGMQKKKELPETPEDVMKKQAEIADRNNKLAYGTFRKGGMTYPTNAIPMHGNQGAWAVPLFANGGETFQVDGPSHEQGGVVIPTPNGDYYEVEKQEVIKRESNADKILSDKLKDKESGKTYALAQKPYEKLKEQVAKFKSDSAKAATEEYASQNFDKLYNRQEMEKSLKQKLQLERDFFKCGGMVKYKDGGIHIKPENRGKFTAAANRAGMGVQEYANHILAHKDNYSSTLVKRANFAHNAAGWKHEDGGIQQFGDGGKKYDSFTQASIDRNKKDLEEYHDAMLKSEFQKNFGNNGSSYNPSIFLMSNYKYLPYNDSLKYSDSAPYYRQLMNGVLKVNEIYDKPNKHEDGGYHPYGPTGYTLTNKVKLNNDPTQLPQGFNYTAYNQFQKYIAGKDFFNDPRLNTNEGKKLYTDQLINEFNQSDYIKKFPQNKITPDYITAVQKYHKLSDPNVVVDGWVGSQTSQMRFPVPEVNEKMTDPNKEYYNATWGNKKYKLPANKFSIDPTNKKGTYSPKDLILVEQRYGGVQKFTKGGEKTDLPTIQEEDPKLYTLEEAANNAFWRNQYPQYFNTPTNNVNPNNPYAGTFNFNMPVGGPLDQAILRDRNQSYASDGIPANAGPASSPNVPSNVTQNQQETSPANKAEGQPGNYNQSGNRFNGDALYSGLGVLANSAGPLAYMIGEGKNYDRQQFYKYSPSELDFTPTKRAYDARRRAVLNNVKNLSGGHSGAALSNIAAQNADLNQSEDTAMREFANQMASIRNQAQQFNIQGQYSVDDINARNKGQALTNYYKSIGALGTNTASGMRDYRMTSQEQEMLPMMKSAFSDPAFLAMYQEYLKKHGK